MGQWRIVPQAASRRHRWGQERTAFENRVSAEGTPILGLFSSRTRELEDYMSDRVQFVITAQEWDPSFEEVSSEGQGKGDPNCP